MYGADAARSRAPDARSAGSNEWGGGARFGSTAQSQQQGVSLVEAAWQWSRLRSSTSTKSADRKILEQILGSAGISGVASIAITLHYPGWWAALRAYLRPGKPQNFYDLGLAYEGARAVEDLRRRQVYRWVLEWELPAEVEVALVGAETPRNPLKRVGGRGGWQG